MGSRIDYVEASAAVLYRNKVYFSSFNPVGALYCYDLSVKTTEFLKQFTVEKYDGMCYGKAILHGNEAWFVPNCARRIVCINLETLEEEYIDIPRHDFMNVNAFKDGIIYAGELLFLIPFGHDCDSMMCVDMKSHRADTYFNITGGHECIGAYIWGKKLHFLSVTGTELSVFDIDTKKVENLDVCKDDDKWGYSSLLQDEDTVYLIPREYDSIGVLNLNTKERKNIPVPGKKEKFWGGISLDDYVLLYSWRTRMDVEFLELEEWERERTRILRVDKESGCVEDIYFPRGATKQIRQWMTNVSCDSDDLYIMGNDGYLFLIDGVGNIKKKWNYSIPIEPGLAVPKVDKRISMEDIRRRSAGGYVAIESRSFELADLISALKSEKGLGK